VTVDKAGALGITSLVSGPEKCIKLFAQNVIRNVKFHLSQQKASQFTAGNALERKTQGFDSKCLNVTNAKVLT